MPNQYEARDRALKKEVEQGLNTGSAASLLYAKEGSGYSCHLDFARVHRLS